MRENSRLLTNRHATCCRGVIEGFGQREVGMLLAALANWKRKKGGGILTREVIIYIAKTVAISLG